MTDPARILPGATLGVFGGGQLGRMFAHAASRMGYRVNVFTNDAHSPAGQVAHRCVIADWSDADAVRRFAEGCAAITLEFENVPVESLEWAKECTLVSPGPNVLAIAQDRIRERSFLVQHGLPCAMHVPVRSAAELEQARTVIPGDAVLKSARFGYDGQGQIRLRPGDDSARAWHQLNVPAAILEQWIEYDCELSVLVARSEPGEVETFGPMRNDHERHILDCSTYPADLPDEVAARAVEIARTVAESCGLIGIICVEMFLSRDGRLIVNELAPRTHNSGHLTIEVCQISQFEQQVRAVCGLPLLPMQPRCAGAMVNLLGDLWQGGEPDWSQAMAVAGVSLHLYGKDQPRPGRKMGHLTAIAESPSRAAEIARSARAALTANAERCTSGSLASHIRE